MKDNQTHYYRRRSLEVAAGKLYLGGEKPVALQSMTNTDTLDTSGTARQSIAIHKAGADLVRITAQSVKAAENFKYIKDEIIKQGFDFPLSADIHFNPKAAMTAALFADKVRINPGNFADTKKFSLRSYTDEEYEAEKDRIRSVFVPFLNRCREYRRSIRIGVNHGSLSDRIMSRYGDTTRGMTESAMEYLRICKEENFTQVILSMKASNPKIMIEANRMLVNAMEKEEMYFPLHIGVTEAGEGEDGRIKSAIGIGALLADGIGDTIRVSLTEAPEKEIPVARMLRDLLALPVMSENHPRNIPIDIQPSKRKSKAVASVGEKNMPVVFAVCNPNELDETGFKDFDFQKDKEIWRRTDTAPDGFLQTTAQGYSVADSPKELPYEHIFKEGNLPHFKSFRVNDFENIDSSALSDDTILVAEFSDQTKFSVQTGRKLIAFLREQQIQNPLLFSYTFSEEEKDHVLKASAFLGSIITDYGIDGLILQTKKGSRPAHIQTAFGILQACRLRISKPDYISCPSCGRTLFDIEKTTALVREKTAHLKGVKIAVMGCIVNGLGEMADADYGYVGAAKGKINLYKNKTLVKKNIPEKNAVEELLKLIESDL